jgi:GalNAc5-diNAcBac-PP-undecaprenol beta-1,3-glucosyltransferase
MIPKVSIIMATYNRAHFIVETLYSIQNQTFMDWECLIIDDGGNDNTPEVVAPFLKKDSRFQFLKRPDSYKKGLPGCRNYGLDLAKGDCVIFFDDDDFVHPDNLKICLKELYDSQKDFCHYQKVSYSDVKPKLKGVIVKERKLLDKSAIEKVITQEIGLASCTVLWKKKCFNQVRFNENLLYAEEWECYSRIISEGFKGVVIDTVLYFNRKHAKSNTSEFYRNNPIRRASYAEAILLVFNNLVESELLTKKLLHYFIQLSLSFKEYKMFQQLLIRVQLSKFKKLKWHFFYFSLPLRLFAYGKLKIIKKIYS